MKIDDEGFKIKDSNLKGDLIIEFDIEFPNKNEVNKIKKELSQLLKTFGVESSIDSSNSNSKRVLLTKF